MKRFLALTLVLTAIQLAIGTLLAVAVFRSVDLRFRLILVLGAAPAFQTLVLMWVTRDPAGRPLMSAPRLFRAPVAVALCVADLAILTLTRVSFRNLLPVVFGAHACVAAIALMMSMKSVEMRHRWILVVAAIGAALYGLSGFTGWMDRLPDLLGRWSTVLRWAAVYVPLFVAAVLVLLRASTAMRSRSEPAAGWIDISVALMLVAGFVSASNIYFHPWLAEPWKTIEHILAYTSLTAIMLATVATMRGADVA